MSDKLPEILPEHCPGPLSEQAGKGDACAGCPSRGLCSSGGAKNMAAVQEEIAQSIATRLADVKHKILVLSGKGGVGKSTMTALLARAIASLNADKNIGVLDIDICGPSQPRALGVMGESVHQSGSGWSPVGVDDNLCVMSIGFLLGSSDDAVVWRGPKKSGMVRQFLADVDWGSLDVLLIDCPPGTSDEHLSVTGYLVKAGLTGAVLVTTPQEVALLDVRKEADFCRKVKVPVLGVIENMSEFVCPSCKSVSELFPATTGGAKAMCDELNLKLLGRIPADPRLARSTDQGDDFLAGPAGQSPAAIALRNLAEGLMKICNTN